MITMCAVVRNEERLLPRCLESVQGVVDEIVLAHDGVCEDGTLDVARSYGARVLERPFAGSSEAHRAATYEAARGEWILQLDADECLPAGTRSAIGELVHDDADAWILRWPAWNGRRHLTRGPFALLDKPVLLRRSKLRFLGVTHLRPMTAGRAVARPDLWIDHRPGYDNYRWAVFRRKWLRWTRVEAEQLLDLENVPRFQLPDDDPELARCRRRRDHPLRAGALELGGFTKWCLVRGLATAGPESWRIYTLMMLRLAATYVYVARLRRR